MYVIYKYLLLVITIEFVILFNETGRNVILGSTCQNSDISTPIPARFCTVYTVYSALCSYEYCTRMFSFN